MITGEEAARETGPLPCFANPPVEQRCIALGKVRHVGEPVALVVADSRYIAEDAIALINVDYEPLPAVSDMMEAINSRGDAVLHPERGPNNVAEHRNTSSGRSSRNSPAPPTWSSATCAGRVPAASRSRPRARSRPSTTARASSRSTSTASMYNYIGFTVAAALKVREPSGQHRAGRRRRQLRQQTCFCTRCGARRARVRASPAARSNTSRTASTTSPRATITDRTASTTSSLRLTPTTG